MNVVMSMLQNAGIQQKIMAQWPPTSHVFTWVSVWDVITVLRDHGQVIHGGNHLKTYHPEITRADHCGPPLDLASIKLKEFDVIDI